MSTQPSKALFVNESAKFSVRNDISHEPLADNELSIEVHFSGVNPADTKHATHLGIRSTVTGYDFCGHVLSSPASSVFKHGDVVAGYSPLGFHRSCRYGTHQRYIACPEDLIFKVPSNLPESHAAALTVVTMTAADVVYNLWNTPFLTTPENITRPILIWGASSSVGLCVVQFAKKNGYRNIFVTASTARHDLLKELGATHVFDYKSPSVLQDIAAGVESLGQGSITYALDAAGTIASPNSAELVLQAVGSIEVNLASVIVREDTRFQMPLGMKKDSWTIQPFGVPSPITIPARPEQHWNAWKALLWAVDNYGKEFRLPSVDVFEGKAEEALQELIKVGDGERGFGKLVIRQPMY
ncbi:chaperonin 10-like protein [Dendryphion nanum]|uniref:Chaperonin 10-like protein n=1 Tax=Dendryphion nanum TaxID=256645 RepID=A0A9P9IDJ4_9PLEO|nr:chaperonin 10-like protein [Dendryphion nanum]